MRNNMKRQLFSGDTSCKSGCIYCFEKWGEFYPRPPFFDVEIISKSEVIICPCCDSEFFYQPQIFTKLLKIIDRNNNVYISISTKTAISDDQIVIMQKLDRQLKESKKGFLKVSVSFSTKYSVNETEPNTLSYLERISLLHRLAEYNIYSSVIIKPMLPFISLGEYFELVDDTSFVGCYLIGDLYVNSNSEFYRNIIDGRYIINARAVCWLKDKPIWNFVDQESRKSELHNYIEFKKCECFNSDIDVINFFRKM